MQKIENESKRCVYVFKSGAKKGTRCTVKPKDAIVGRENYCSIHKKKDKQQSNDDSMRCVYMYETGAKKGTRCTVKPKNAIEYQVNYCSIHKKYKLKELVQEVTEIKNCETNNKFPKTMEILNQFPHSTVLTKSNLKQNIKYPIIKSKQENKYVPSKKQVKVEENIITSNKVCNLLTCDRLCNSTDKYCQKHSEKITIYKPEYGGDVLINVGLVFAANTSRYRSEKLTWNTDRVIGKIVNEEFVEELNQNELEYIADMGFIYKPREIQYMKVNIKDNYVCDVCFKYCITVASSCNIDLIKRCNVCELNNLTQPSCQDEINAYKLIGIVCYCKLCNQWRDEEGDRFDSNIKPYLYETTERIKCKCPMCNHHVEDKTTQMCSLCLEAPLNGFDLVDGVLYKCHLQTKMIVKISGEQKTVVGKIPDIRSTYKQIEFKISKFDLELARDFNWKIESNLLIES